MAVKRSLPRSRSRQMRLAETETKFGIGSITKSFTAALFAWLLEEGKVDLDAPVDGEVATKIVEAFFRAK